MKSKSGAYGLPGEAHRLASHPSELLAPGALAAVGCGLVAGARSAAAEGCLSLAGALFGKLGRKSVGEISK